MSNTVLRATDGTGTPRRGTRASAPRAGAVRIFPRATTRTMLALHADMRIDIDKLTEAELIDLNNRIVARVRFLSQMRAHARMLDFKIGDRVSFQPEGRGAVVGMLSRYNRKTVTVVTDDGQRWNVSPRLVRRAENTRSSESGSPAVILLRRK